MYFFGKSNSIDLKKLLARIRRGESVDSSELLPHLCVEDGALRCSVNFRLAEAFADIGNLEQARIFINRSWILSKFSKDILPLYIEIHSALDDIDSIRDAYKRLGMIEASNDNISGALQYFNLWHYGYANHERKEKYEYDFDILERVEKMAEPWRFKRFNESERPYNRRIRLAYLMFGVTHINSVLVKINLTFAKYHDKRRFEVSFFVPEPKRIVYASNAALETIEKLKKYSCNVVIAPGWRNNLNNLLAVANEIYKYKADVLITSALLAEFEHYFIASLRPAPVIIGLLQGPPAQFVAPTLDWSISWSKHPLIDSPCDCSLFHLGLDLPDRDSIKHYSKDDLGIPGDCEVLMSAGRHVKFQNADFWNGILDILACFPNVYYIAVGVSREQVPFLDALLTPELSKRIILMGWREDFLAILSLANVLIDTFPSGGGHVLIEAMSLGIPFISFENDYMKNFDQSEWSVADEFVSIPELMVKRNNFLQFKRIAGKLIDDTEYRMEMGRLCKEQVNILMGSAEEKVRKYESVLLRVIEKKVVSKKWMNGTDDKDSNGHLSGQIKNLISRIKNYIFIQSGSRRKS